MVVLRILTLFLILLSSSTSFGHPNSGQSELIHSGAWNSLKNCEWSRASVWADLLGPIDPQAAILYKLAWFQIQRDRSSNSSSIEGDDSWSWKQDRELWSDENEPGTENHLCKPLAEIGSVAYSKLPQDVLNNLIHPQIARYASLRPPLRNIIRSYILYKWTLGEFLSLEKLSLPEHWPLTEKCDWNALRLIHSKSESQEEFDDLLNRCQNQQGLLWAIVQVKDGDLHLKGGDANHAFSLYQSAHKLIQDRILSKQLEYRIAVSGFLSRAKDDLALRMAYKILLDENEDQKSSNQLEPLFRSTLQNLVCERISAIQPKDAMKLLSRIFQSKVLVADSIRLTQECAPSDVEPFWKVLLSVSTHPREKASLLSMLLSSALHRNAFIEAKNHTLLLATISKKLPYVASHYFWNALSTEMKPIESALRMKVARLYQTKAQWLSVDEQKLQRLKSNKKDEPQMGSNALRTETYQANQPIHVSVALSAPPVILTDEISAHFFRSLGEDFFSPMADRTNP